MESNYIACIPGFLYRDAGLAYMRKELPRVSRWDQVQGVSLYQIGSDGCMLYGDSMSIHPEDIEELRRLSSGIADRIEESTDYCCDYCGEYWYRKDLTLSEIMYLWERKKSKWFYEKVMDQNTGYFRKELGRLVKKNREKMKYPELLEIYPEKLWRVREKRESKALEFDTYSEAKEQWYKFLKSSSAKEQISQ